MAENASLDFQVMPKTRFVRCIPPLCNGRCEHFPNVQHFTQVWSAVCVKDATQPPEVIGIWSNAGPLKLHGHIFFLIQAQFLNRLSLVEDGASKIRDEILGDPRACCDHVV